MTQQGYFSQENIFRKSTSFFGATKHGKVSTQKNNLKKLTTELWIWFLIVKLQWTI